MPEMFFCPIAELIFDKLTSINKIGSSSSSNGNDGGSIDKKGSNNVNSHDGNDNKDQNKIDVDNDDDDDDDASEPKLSFDEFITVMNIFSMNIPVTQKADCKCKYNDDDDSDDDNDDTDDDDSDDYDDTNDDNTDDDDSDDYDDTDDDNDDDDYNDDDDSDDYDDTDDDNTDDDDSDDNYNDKTLFHYTVLFDLIKDPSSEHITHDSFIEFMSHIMLRDQLVHHTDQVLSVIEGIWSNISSIDDGSLKQIEFNKYLCKYDVHALLTIQY
jgi:hypothetical protein